MLKNIKKFLLLIPLFFSFNLNYGANPAIDFESYIPDKKDAIPTQEQKNEMTQKVKSLIKTLKPQLKKFFESKIMDIMMESKEITDPIVSSVDENIVAIDEQIVKETDEIQKKIQQGQQKVYASTLNALRKSQTNKKIDVDDFLSDDLINFLGEGFAGLQNFVDLFLKKIPDDIMKLIAGQEQAKKFLEHFLTETNGQYTFDPTKLIKKLINFLGKAFVRNKFSSVFNFILNSKESADFLQYSKDNPNINMKEALKDKTTGAGIFVEKLLKSVENPNLKILIEKWINEKETSNEDILQIFDFYRIFNQIKTLVKQLNADMKDDKKSIIDRISSFNKLLDPNSDHMKFINTYLSDSNDDIFTNKLMGSNTKKRIIDFMNMEKNPIMKKFKDLSDAKLDPKKFKKLLNKNFSNEKEMKKIITSFMKQYDQLQKELEKIKTILKLDDFNNLTPVDDGNSTLKKEELKQIEDCEKNLEKFFEDEDNKKIFKSFRDEKSEKKLKSEEDQNWYQTTAGKTGITLAGATAAALLGKTAFDHLNKEKSNNSNNSEVIASLSIES